MADLGPNNSNPLNLPQVTICIATSVALAQSLAALQASRASIRFGDAVFFSHTEPPGDRKSVRLVRIPPLLSREDYSRFILKDLHRHIETEHVLIVQWDGYVLSPTSWSDDFLSFDYIGAPWPQFSDGHVVGNGGFSLRSRRLLRACADPRISLTDPEDFAIGRTHRSMLERDYGILFADEAIASRFAFERNAPVGNEFGFHGVFNMPDFMGKDAFLAFFKSLPPGLIGRRERRDLIQLATRQRDSRLLWALLAPYLASPQTIWWERRLFGTAIKELFAPSRRADVRENGQ